MNKKAEQRGTFVSKYAVQKMQKNAAFLQFFDTFFVEQKKENLQILDHAKIAHDGNCTPPPAASPSGGGGHSRLGDTLCKGEGGMLLGPSDDMDVVSLSGTSAAQQPFSRKPGPSELGFVCGAFFCGEVEDKHLEFPHRG